MVLTEKKTQTGGGKVVSLLLLFLLIFSHTEDPGLLSVIKISHFSAAVD